MKKKKCSNCNVNKNIKEFSKDKSKKDGLNNWCKSCEKEYSKKYRENTKEERKEYNKNYGQTINGKYNDYKHSAQKRNIKFNLTIEQFISFWQKQCFYCGSEIKTIGLDRINNNIGYELTNCCACCERCNRAKLCMSIDEWENYLKNLLRYQAIKSVIINPWIIVLNGWR